MKKEQIVAKEYTELMESIKDWQEGQVDKIKGMVLYEELKSLSLQEPVLTQLTVRFPEDAYKDMFCDFISFMSAKSPDYSNQFVMLESHLVENGFEEWIKETIRSNYFYFEKLSSQLKIEAWIPQFIAEYVTRIYLQEISKRFEDKYEESQVTHVCKFCSEPIRLALMEKDGKKMVTCPRCYAKWNNKKLSCSICNNTNHEMLTILKIEEDKVAEIQYCKECHGYTKLIKIHNALCRPVPDLLDLYTIQFDYVAQQYMEGKNEEENRGNA